MRKIALLAAFGAAACAVVLGGGASASTSGNHTVFTDPFDDAQHSSNTNYAADIHQVDVTSKDSGLVTFAVTLQDADAKLVQGDELSLYIDIDRKASTGDSNGFEYEFIADGSSSGTTFTFCTLLVPRTCREWTSAHDAPTSSNTHVVDFSIPTDAAAFDFAVLEAYTEPGQTGTLYDVAPDTGRYTFETKTDPDGDGLYGSGDKCPTVGARGTLDKNNNGCPGPFQLIQEQLHSATTGPRPGYLQVQRLWLTGVPPGASVVISSPRGVERLVANSAGKVTSRRVCCGGNGPLFRIGSKVTVRITKSGGFVGVVETNTVQKRGLITTSRKCLPATGGGPVACSAKLKGS